MRVADEQGWKAAAGTGACSRLAPVLEGRGSTFARAYLGLSDPALTDASPARPWRCRRRGTVSNPSFVSWHVFRRRIVVGNRVRVRTLAGEGDPRHVFEHHRSHRRDGSAHRIAGHPRGPADGSFQGCVRSGRTLRRGRVGFAPGSAHKRVAGGRAPSPPVHLPFFNRMNLLRTWGGKHPFLPPFRKGTPFPFRKGTPLWIDLVFLTSFWARGIDRDRQPFTI